MSWRVKDVYSDRCILLTGSTGFLGKVLVEKILWAVPNVGQIFLLIRPAKGMSPKERLEKVLKDPLFNRIREHKPHMFSKLVPISGDLMEDNLGLNQHDMQNICDEVSIVIHSAATVKFDEQLKDAVEMNVVGTTRLVALCHKMKNLVALVHVSTAYANCDRAETEEKVYEPPVAPQKLLEAIRWMDNDMIALITPKLLGNRPNTYTLTKALAETQLVEDAKQLPVIIIRPSIVGAMWKDPLPGWTDNINGPTGIFAAVGKGVLTNMCGSVHSKADIIPVDIVANMIIVAAAHRATTMQVSILMYPMQECFAIPSTRFHSSRRMFELNYYVKHHIPASTMDFVSGLIGRKSKNVRLYAKVWRMVETLHYFTTHGWTFQSKNLPKLWDSLHFEDQQQFNFDIRQLDWDSYLFDYVMGIKRYILKDDLDQLQVARANLARNSAIHLFLMKLNAALKFHVQYWLRFVRCTTKPAIEDHTSLVVILVAQPQAARRSASYVREII
ncbi:NAD-binding protein [Ancylostoma ceylanicum]|uniref:Fatty acyl-CoA reductase n=1 Tax=Ancylostoma ceylanicum TaxID=53326 RepID=A0A0D6MAA1_9BILA|nr:NAD-binding protein [Ancylostoma ceylanicum]